MMRPFARLADRLRTRAEVRRKRRLDRAVKEREVRTIDDGTIWRSGKGGSHQR
jgi:hypothetical protein